MNIIIKPGGLILLIAAFTTLSTSVVLFYKQKERVVAASLSSLPNIGTAAVVSSSVAESAPDDDTTAADNWRLQAEPGLVKSGWTKGPNADWPKARLYTVGEKKGQSSWDVQSYQPLEEALPKGTRIQVRFWGRSKDNGLVVMVMEKQAAPYTRLAIKEVALSPEWRTCLLETTLTQTLPTGWGKIGLQFGARPGEVEVAGAEVVTAKHP